MMTGRQAMAWAGVSLAAVLIAGGADAAGCGLADLHWLKGVWRADGAGTQSEERWTIASGGRLMGSSWLLHDAAPGGVIEASTIQADGAAVVMRLRHFSGDLALAREEKDAPMVFIAALCGANSVVFDGQGAQVGEHMTYRRETDRLTFIGEFLHQGKPVQAELSFRHAGD